MSEQAANPRASNRVVRRCRTGCLTCRKRKLKCDEQRPVCGQCLKSHRECVPAEAVTFRHQQNAALNTSEEESSLGSFYKYKNKFTRDELRNFLPVPQSLQFVHVDDPYDEDQNSSSAALTTRIPSSTSDSFQQVAAHTLEALSTAAADHPPYPTLMSHSYADLVSVHASHLSPHSESGGNIRHDGIHATVGGGQQNNNISFLLNPSSTPSAMIDPNLESIAQAHLESNTDGNRFGNDDDDGEAIAGDHVAGVEDTEGSSSLKAASSKVTDRSRNAIQS